MGMLDELLGAGGLSQLSGLVAKHEGADTNLTHEEAHELHETVAQHASPEEYHAAATSALSQLSPEQHGELAAHVTQQAQAQGVDVQALAGGHSPQSVGGLASILSGLQKQGGQGGSGGGLMGMLGGSGGMMSNPLVSMAIGGIGAMLMKQMMHR